MKGQELILPVGAYLLSCYSLGLVSWALVDLFLPRQARTGLRLLAVLAGQLALTAILVQALGLAGILRAPSYLACSLLPGLAATWLRRGRRPQRAFFRLLKQGARLFVVAPGWGLGWLTAIFLLYLCRHFLSLPADIDALSLHGPLIVEWVQSGQITLSSTWNYPQCWEYQFVPSFLLLRADLLAIVPGMLAIAAIFLAVREVAIELQLGARAGHLLAFLCGTMPILWRDTLKGDPIFGASLLLAVLALARALRYRKGSFFLLQLAMFLMVGSKSTGFVYAALFLAAYGAVYWAGAKGASQRSRVALALGATFLVQATPAAMLLRNLFIYGNPVHPVQVELAGQVWIADEVSLKGTSILGYLGLPETWWQLVLGGIRAVGFEWPFLLLLFLFALISSRRWGRPFGRLAPWIVLPLALLFFATPWTYNLSPGAPTFLPDGISLRFAIAPICLLVLVAARAAGHLFGRASLRRWLLPAVLVAIAAKWIALGLWAPSYLPAYRLLALAILAALSAPWAFRLWRRLRGRGRLLAAALPLALLLLSVSFARWTRDTRELSWQPLYRDVWTWAWHKIPPGSKIAVNAPQARFTYLLYGPHFENRIVPIELAGPEPKEAMPEDLRYFYYFDRREVPRRRFLERLTARGWRTVASAADGRGVLLER